MRRHRLGTVATLTLLVAFTACRHPGTTTVTPWAQQAETWTAAMNAAGLAGIENVVRFYADDAVFDDRPSHRLLTGRADIAEFALDVLGETTPFIPMALFVSADEAVVQFEWPLDPPIDFADRLVMGRDGIELRVVSPSLEGGLGYAAHAWDFSAVDALVDRWVAAWAGDLPLDQVYADDATVDDTLVRRSISGRIALEATVGTGRWPDLGALRVEELPHGRGRAVYLAAAADAPGSDEIRIVLVTGDTSCPAVMMTTLGLENGLVVWERRHHEVTSTRRCVDTSTFADGWWQEVDVPSPVADRITAVIVDGADAFEVHNGSPGPDALVRWGLDRFRLAGLTPPRLGSVTFVTDAERCEGLDGWSTRSAGGERISICLHADEICADDACSTWSLEARLALLHELAHGWLSANLDDTERQAFVDFVGVSQWNDPDDAWIDRGVERAASTIGTGLVDDFDGSGCVNPAYCNVKGGGFALLTGLAPIGPPIEPEPDA
jgi:hypothetical protein